MYNQTRGVPWLLAACSHVRLYAVKCNYSTSRIPSCSYSAQPKVCTACIVVMCYGLLTRGSAHALWPFAATTAVIAIGNDIIMGTAKNPHNIMHLKTLQYT